MVNQKNNFCLGVPCHTTCKITRTGNAFIASVTMLQNIVMQKCIMVGALLMSTGPAAESVFIPNSEFSLSPQPQTAHSHLKDISLGVVCFKLDTDVM